MKSDIIAVTSFLDILRLFDIRFIKSVDINFCQLYGENSTFDEILKKD